MKKRNIIIIAGILSIIAFIYIFPSMAKFVTDKVSSYFLKSRSFYFNSNLLNENKASYTINTWSGVGPFSINIKLFSKENELLYSESDINYNITVNCPDDVTCLINKNFGVLYSADVNHTENIVIDVNPKKVFTSEDILNIYVEAKSSSPYEKTLSADFKYLVSKEGVSFEIEDEKDRKYLFLKIINDTNYCTVKENFWSYKVGDKLSDTEYKKLSKEYQKKCISKTINVTFDPNEIIMDSTDNIINDSAYTTIDKNDIKYINGLTYNIAPRSASTIKFFKQDPTKDNSTIMFDDDTILKVNVVK